MQNCERLKPLYKQKGLSPIQEYLQKCIIMQIYQHGLYEKQTNSTDKPSCEI